MFKCVDCNQMFSDFRTVVEEHGEKFGICPYCGMDFEEARLCPECLEFFTDGELDDGVCVECASRLEDEDE